MRKIVFIMLTVVVGLLIGCEQSTASGTENTNPFIGRWKTAYNYTFSPESPFPNQVAAVTLAYTFNANNTYVLESTNSLMPNIPDETGSYSFSNEVLGLESSTSEKRSFSYHFQDGKLYLNETEYIKMN